ncbi:MAG: VWA domain-containing protein [Blastocatellia bacterium]
MKKIIQKLAFAMLILTFSLLSAACGAQKREQILFIIDSSSSMIEPAGYPEYPDASRWQVVQRLAPDWLSRIPNDTLVGAVSVGGNCDGTPAINLMAGANRSLITAAIAKGVPNGVTPLNAALKATPSMFATDVEGSKRVVVFSDGLNTCPPEEPTCEIVRELHAKYGIVVDVVAWVTEPSMADEFKCVADSGGGTFTTPRTFQDLIDLPFLLFDPWRYIVLALGLMTLMFGSLVMYRQAYYAMNWNNRTASVVSSVITAASALTLYVVLFAGAGWLALLFSMALITAGVAVAVSRSNRSKRSSPVVAGVLVIIWLAACPLTASSQSGQCSQTVQGNARYHHILALDMSGTVTGSFNEMKALVSCYAKMYTLPGEEISLVAFGINAQGATREVASFTVPQSRSTETLTHALNDLEIQNPAQTRTYFKPLADYFSQRLKTVRLEPVMLVISDGKSDGFEDARLGRVNFREIPFESFGKRGMYAAPGVSGWKVAVQGGAGLDLTTLFKQRVSPNLIEIDEIPPCLVDPDLLFETSDTVTLKPSLNPFSNSVEGTLTMTVSHECVSRYRSFRVEIRRGNEVREIGAISNVSINVEPSELSFSLRQDASGVESSEAVVQLQLNQGDTERTIYAVKPSRIVIKEVSYMSAFGVYWGVALGAMVVLLSIFVIIMKRQHVRKSSQPQLIAVMGGSSVPLGPNQRVEIGGAGAALQVPGVGAGIILGSIESITAREKFTVQAADRFRMKVNGIESTGSSAYTLGTPLQFINTQDEATYDVTLYSGSAPGSFTNTDPDGGSFPGLPSFQDFSHSGTGQSDSFSSGGNDIYI